MASLTSILLLVDLATGESAYGPYANWGAVTDGNLAFLEDTVGEVTSKTLASSNVTLTDDEERSLFIKLSGTLGANVEVRTNDRKGFWLVKNDCTGAFTVTFKPTSGTGIVVPQGGAILAVCDGTNTTLIGTNVGEFSGMILVPANQDYRIALNLPFPGQILAVTTRCTSGTCTLTGKINTTALGGTANAVSSAEQEQAHSSNNTWVIGDDIVLTISANASCLNLSFTIKYVKK